MPIRMRVLPASCAGVGKFVPASFCAVSLPCVASRATHVIIVCPTYTNNTRQQEKLASAVKGTVKIAYWDTEQAGGRPPLLGEIKGTPTIRFYKPKPKQEPGKNTKKIVLDYNYERKAKDMKQFVDANIPSFIEKVNGAKDIKAFEDKAARNGLPQVLLFTAKPNTSPLTKYLSTEFRRRILLAEIKPTKPNKDIIEKYGIADFPAMVVVPPVADEDLGSSDDGDRSGRSDEIVRYEGDGFSRNKLQSFLTKHALKKPVIPPKKKKKEPGENEEEKRKEGPQKEAVKTEL